MKRSPYRRAGALLLSAALLTGLFSGCGLSDESDADQAETEAQEEASPRATSVLTVTENQGDGIFTVAYSAGHSFNPYTSESRDNLQVAGLIYEGLYALDKDFTAERVLAQSLTTVDGLSYTLVIQSGVKFHNGDELTAADVIYSLERAKDSELYASRLSVIASASQPTDSEGEADPYTVDITLNKAHGNLPVLLTFPIIQYDSVEWTAPPGTGPYQAASEGGTECLQRYTGYWGETAPIDTIYLREATTMEQLTADFNSGVIDIVALDRMDTGTPNFSGNKEVRDYDTTLMDYIGFNVLRDETGKEEVRQAISYAIDRAYITDNIMDGAAVASALPLHPSLSYYDADLHDQFSYDLDKAVRILEGSTSLVGPEIPTGEDGDADEDGEEAPAAEEPSQVPEEDDDGDEVDDDDDEDEEDDSITLTLLVCSDNTTRRDAAVYIAQCVSSLGYKVTVDDRPYDEYVEALERGDFDLFYGQVRLKPDFDLTQVVSGSLAFAGMGGLVQQSVIDDFLASGQSDRADTARLMCQHILTTAPIAVIGFRHLSVVTQQGTVTGMNPTGDNIYNGVFDWTVDIK